MTDYLFVVRLYLGYKVFVYIIIKCKKRMIYMVYTCVILMCIKKSLMPTGSSFLCCTFISFRILDKQI